MKDKLFIISLILILLSVGWLLLEIRRGTYIQNTCPNYISKEVSQPALIYNLILCESNWRPNVYGDINHPYGPSIGLIQVQQRTWDWLSKKMDFHGDIYNSDDQIRFLILAIEKGYGKHWTCYRKIVK